jgi:TRAP-type C4-dicarboxylate transport system permease small subunit
MRTLAFVPWLNKATNVIAGTVLTCMMLFTTLDVIMRYLGKPILGSFELVSLAGVAVIGFAMPHTSWTLAHVNVDFLVTSMNEPGQKVTNVATRILSIALFAALGVFLIKKGLYMASTGEVTSTLQIPFYPVSYGLAVCCFLQCLILVCQIVKIAGERHE